MTLNMNIDDLVRGSRDTHVHFAPDAFGVFRMDALDTLKSVQQTGLRSVVLESQTYLNTPVAAMSENWYRRSKSSEASASNTKWVDTIFIL